MIFLVRHVVPSFRKSESITGGRIFVPNVRHLKTKTGEFKMSMITFFSDLAPGTVLWVRIISFLLTFVKRKYMTSM